MRYRIRKTAEGYYSIILDCMLIDIVTGRYEVYREEMKLNLKHQGWIK